MSAPNIQKAINRALAQLPVAAGNGLDACVALLTQFCVEIATSAADWVHFENDHHGAPAPIQAAMIEAVATDLIASMSKTLRAAGLDDAPWAIEVRATAIRTYRARLAELAAAPKHGGAA